MCGAIYSDAVGGMVIVCVSGTGTGSCYWSDSGRLLSGRNGKQCDYLYCRRRCGSFRRYDDRLDTDRTDHDTASGLWAGWCLGGGILLGYGIICGKSNSDSGTDRSSFEQIVSSSDSENP